MLVWAFVFPVKIVLLPAFQGQLFNTSKGAVEHSIDTELEYAMILWEMLKYFQISFDNL